MTLALLLFGLMYILLLSLPKYRPQIALGTAFLFVILGILPIKKVIPAINFNVILMLAGMMMLVQLFISSNMPTLVAEKLLKITANVKWAIVVLSLFAGLVSAFIDNVATLLMISPIGISIAKKLKINPVPVIISIAVSSNLQGAATLVGDTTSILLGAYTKMNFNDFFIYHGKVSIGIATEVGALLTIPVLLFLFRHEKEKVSVKAITKVTNYIPTILLLGVIFSLIIASQVPNLPSLTNGFICLFFAFVALLYEIMWQRNKKAIKQCLQAIDYKTLLLLSGLFIVIQGINEAGVIKAMANLFSMFGGHNLLLVYVLVVFISVVISAFVDNIPYVATMLPVMQKVAFNMAIDPTILYFGLLIGATLGGNLTPIGASANITGIGILNSEGYEVKTSDFMKIGIPYTLVAVLAGSIFIWLIWH